MTYCKGLTKGIGVWPFFHPIVNCDTIENDLCEAFNARIIEARIN